MKSSERRLLALCRKEKFEPDPNQKRAIFHVNGPLYLPAGPGAGKTGVLLWRALNLILFHEVKPDQIFLATFTEKAALRLRDGLQGLLVESDSCFDISSMYVGTVHALCRRLIEDRRFSPDRVRPRAPELLDELGQLLYVYKHWKELLASAGLTSGAEESINNIFDRSSSSRYEAAAKCITFFNRLSEECVDPAIARHRSRDKGLLTLLDLYEAYRRSLRQNTDRPLTDFSLLQQEALRVLERSSSSTNALQTPSWRNTGLACGGRLSPILFGGRPIRARINARTPACARKMAAERPAVPLPRMATSANLPVLIAATEALHSPIG